MLFWSAHAKDKQSVFNLYMDEDVSNQVQAPGYKCQRAEVWIQISNDDIWIALGTFTNRLLVGY